MIEDGELIAFMHGEVDAGARARIETQVASSRATADRLRQMRERESRLSTMLHTLDPDEISTRRSAGAARAIVGSGRRLSRSTSLLRAAAIIGLLGATALLVQPVRAVVADAFRALSAAVGIGGSPQSPAPPSSPETAASVRTTFAWSAPVFTIELAEGAGATAEISIGAAAAATIVHPSAVPLVVTPSGIRIGVGAAPEYVLVLPPSVRTVRVVQGARITDHAMTGAAIRIQLGRSD